MFGYRRGHNGSHQVGLFVDGRLVAVSSQFARDIPQHDRVPPTWVGADPHDPKTGAVLVDSLLYDDSYMLLADYASYIECQERVDQAYRDREQWTRSSILNVARGGKFSSDRAIREYCEEIWDVRPIKSVGAKPVMARKSVKKTRRK